MPRSGFVSSEFWLHIAAIVLPAVGTALAAVPNPVIAGIAQAVITVVGLLTAGKYAEARTDLKAAAVEAAKTAAVVATTAVIAEVTPEVTPQVQK